ncbi:MAG TPA: 16S rRNA (cytosine(1402)-N(4))-methyltransferase RsmH [Firmicutes bacterium]|nr:16S rRNA (cytosine(1402)-N(4))-methyltransferase RsmH [Bacillota bacterium]
MTFLHEPVLLQEVLSYLACQPEGVYIDCTVGGAGHAAAMLDRSSPTGRLLGIDQDEAALAAAAKRLQPYGKRVQLTKGNFRCLDEIWQTSGLGAPLGVLFDLGVSSPQLDEKERGFSYQEDAPLDMRMDPKQAVTAATLINTLPERELAQIISQYGEERWAVRIAKFIGQRRQQQPITTTAQMVDVIKAAIPAAARRRGPHPARRTFQALRIAVNDELAALRKGLEAAGRILAPSGRLCVISFHSLEDRIVKHTFRSWAQEGGFTVLTKRPVVPSPEEAKENPRARSAKLRAIRRRP